MSELPRAVRDTWESYQLAAPVEPVYTGRQPLQEDSPFVQAAPEDAGATATRSPAPASAPNNRTRRGRLDHICRLNHAAIDYYVGLALDDMPKFVRAWIKGAGGFFKIDLFDHPHKLILLLLGSLTDDAVDELWELARPLAAWVDAAGPRQAPPDESTDHGND